MIFKGVKVLDLSTLLPGPMCSLFLADLGADVIKIESLSGDAMRRFQNETGKSPYFNALNRNKKSIALNLKTSEGRKIFMKLARSADVVIEGFRPGKVESLGAGYRQARKINPKIIYCSITGYGQKGAYRNKAGHDLNYAALSGVLDVISEKPFVAGMQIADAGSALIAAFAIAAALFQREKTGKGEYIDIAVTDGALSLISMHLAYRSISNNRKTILSGSMPCYNVYETKDSKFVSMGAIEQKFWELFCSSMGRKDLLAKQFDGSVEVMKEMKSIFKSRTLKEWVAANNKHDFCCEPVKKIGEIVNDNYFKSRKMLVELDGIIQAGLPVFFSSLKKRSDSRAPKLGEHTLEILKSIGYNGRQIAKMKANGVVL